MARSMQSLLLSSILLIGIGVGFRIWFSHTWQVQSVFPDTMGYYRRGIGILEKPSIETLVDYARTPLYPMYLVFPFYGQKQFPDSQQFSQNVLAISRVQFVNQFLNIISAVFFYILLRKLSLRQPIALLGGIGMVTSMLLVPWEFTLLSESLSIPMVILTAFSLLWYLKQPKTELFLGIVLFVGVMLRPASLIFSLLLLFFVCIRNLEMRKLPPVLACALLILGIAGYTYGNQKKYGVPLFQAVSSINVLGRILGKNIPVHQNEPIGIGKAIAEYRKSGNEQNPFIFLPAMYPFYENDPRFYFALQQFTTQTLLTSPTLFLSAISDIPVAIGQTSEAIVVPDTPSTHLFSVLQRLNQAIVTLSVILTPFGILYFWKKRKQKNNEWFLIIGLTCLFSLVPTILFSYEDYPRFLLPYIPFSYAILIYVCDYCFFTLTSRLFLKRRA